MKKKFYWVLIVVFAVVFLISGVVVVDYIVKSYEHQKKMEQLQNMYTTSPNQNTSPSAPITTGPQGSTPGGIGSTPGGTLPSGSILVPPTTMFPTEPTVPLGPPIEEELAWHYANNKDVVGWIRIDGTRINYPVMQRVTEKDYYLDKDFWGDKDKHGSIYVREVCDVFEPSDNVTMYGHQMADGTMFADIHKFKKADFFQEHPTIQFDTLYERHTYQIVCIFRTSGTFGEGFPFHLYDDFSGEEEFNEFIDGVRDLAIQDSGIEVEYGDKFICLSTCERTVLENGRLVLVAVRID